MREFKDKKAAQKLLKTAISQLCRVSVGLEGNFTIDGIICIAQGESDEQEVVVKIHEVIEDKQTSDSVSVVQNSSALNLTANQTNTITTSTQSEVFRSESLPLLDHRNLYKDVKLSSKRIAAKTPSSLSGKQLLELDDDDVECLGISQDGKQLFGELENFSDIECTGYDFDDVSFNDVVIKPDPGYFGKSIRGYASSRADEESSDEELKIEQLKAGRVRKPHKGSYRDVHGAPVQLLSTEEFTRILKSEKLKRSRDKSPDFVSAQKVLKTGQDIVGAVQLRPNPAQLHSISLQSQMHVPKTLIGSVSYIPNNMHSSELQPVPSRQVTSIVKHPNPNSIRFQNDAFSSGTNTQLRKPIAKKQAHVQQFVTQNLKTDGPVSLTPRVRAGNDSGCLLPTSSNEYNVQNCITSTQIRNIRSNELHELPVSESYSLIPQTVLRQVQSPANPMNQLDKFNHIQDQATDNTNSDAAANVMCLDACNEATKSTIHKCPVCHEVLQSFRQLDLHMYRHHPGMFLCPVCGKSFKQRSTRNRHIVALHSSEKNFTCHICNAAFTRTDTLRKHVNICHPGVDIPKHSFSYVKGVVLQSQQVQEQQLHDSPSSEQLSVHNNQHVYGEGVITPIQVTAASIEAAASPLTDSTPLTDSSGVTLISGSITNITPINSIVYSDPALQTHNITPSMSCEVSNEVYVSSEPEMPGVCESSMINHSNIVVGNFQTINIQDRTEAVITDVAVDEGKAVVDSVQTVCSVAMGNNPLKSQIETPVDDISQFKPLNANRMLHDETGLLLKSSSETSSYQQSDEHVNRFKLNDGDSSNKTLTTSKQSTSEYNPENNPSPTGNIISTYKDTPQANSNLGMESKSFADVPPSCSVVNAMNVNSDAQRVPASADDVHNSVIQQSDMLNETDKTDNKITPQCETVYRKIVSNRDVLNLSNAIEISDEDTGDHVHHTNNV